MDRITGWLWRYRGRILAGLASLVVVDAATLIVPLVLRDAIDGLTAGTASLLRSGLTIAGLAVITMVFRFFWRFFLIGSARRIERDLRAKLFDHLVGLSADFYNDAKTGDLMAHATNDIDAVARACGAGVITILDPMLMIPVSIGIMLTIQPTMTLYSVLPLPILTLVMLAFGRVIHRRFRSVQEAFSTAMEKVRETVSGIRVLKSFVQETGSEDDFATVNQSLVDENMALVRVHGVFHPLIELLGSMTLALILWIGGISVIRTTVSLGGFVAFTQYLSMLIWPMVALGRAVNIFQRGRASLGRINRLLAIAPGIKAPIDPRPLESTGIEIRDLTFSYTTDPAIRPALSEIRLSIEPGQTLGIVGQTGSGKSTLAHLIPRIFDPPPGTLLVGGIDLREIDLTQLRRTIGFVPQDPFLFSATIAENIAFGFPEAPFEAIERAAQLAGIDEEIRSFPEGYATRVGERGISLSGGQKQRVAIARALLLDPKVVVFDDALSAVDAEREEVILANLRQFFRGRTCLIVAHRISAVMGANRIVVLDEGRIVQSGTHTDLAEVEGIYRRIWRLQQAERRVIDS